MNFIKIMIEKRVNFLMSKIEEIAKDFVLEDGTIVENASAGLKNKELMNKIAPLQIEITLYLNMGLQDAV